MQFERSRQDELAWRLYRKLRGNLWVQTILKQGALKREKKQNALLAAVEENAMKDVASKPEVS